MFACGLVEHNLSADLSHVVPPVHVIQPVQHNALDTVAEANLAQVATGKTGHRSMSVAAIPKSCPHDALILQRKPVLCANLPIVKTACRCCLPCCQ